MTARFLLLLLPCLFLLPAHASTCIDCTARCCAQSALGQVCEPSCQRDCDAARQICLSQTSTTPTQNSPLVARVEPAISGGMLLPGWQAVAEQALGDIRTVERQMHPGAVDAPRASGDGARAQPLIERFVADSASAPEGGSGQGREQQLIETLWQTGTLDAAPEETAAQRLARSNTFAGATAQLARSVYAGPPGAAAYAAWWAYRQPGATPMQALRVGLLAGGGLWDAELSGDGPTAPAQVVQRTSLAAALGGLAVAAAGGDEQALRASFFDSGAAVLLQDGAQLHCFSARVQCQHLPAEAVVSRAGRAVGWAPERLRPMAPGVGVDFAPTPPANHAPTPILARPQGSLALDQGWTLNWQFPKGMEPGVLYPSLVLTGARPGDVASAAAPAAKVAAPAAPKAVSEPALEAALAEPPAAGPAEPAVRAPTRVLCQRGADRRFVWLLPADPKGAYVCRVMYQVGNTPSVLWNAQQNSAACVAKAEARVAQEQARGYQCSKVPMP